MKWDPFFPRHVQRLQGLYEETLELLRAESIEIDAVLLHSGSARTYFRDDAEIPFRAHPHFTHWLPVSRPDQFVLVVPGRKPTYFMHRPATYWSDTEIELSRSHRKAFRVVELDAADRLLDRLPRSRRIAFIGEDTALAGRLGLPSALHNQNDLRNRLDYHRSLKSDYEVEVIREANRRAHAGHEAAGQAFEDGAGERQILAAYLAACDALESEMPFDPIVALDDRAAVLHYQQRRPGSGARAQLALVDAGYRLEGYAADLTRTHVRDTAHPVMRELVARVTALKDQMIRSLRPGVSFKALNRTAHTRITRILRDLDIIRGSAAELRTARVSALFFPHGLGHLLGIQVHDVGGLFKDASGVREPPADEHKNLRLTRKLEPGMVLTVEPGIYFIPMLLDGPDAADKQQFLNRPLIEALTPLGGVRIEDNVVMRESAAESLTPRSNP